MERLQAAVEKAREQRRGKAEVAAEAPGGVPGEATLPAEAPLAESPPGVPFGAQPMDGQPTGGQPADGRPTDGRATDGQPTQGRPLDGRGAPDAVPPPNSAGAPAAGFSPAPGVAIAGQGFGAGVAAGRPRPEHRANIAAHPAVTAAWKALRPLEIESGLLRRNRLVSLDGGLEAGPFDLLRTKIIQQTALNNWRRIAIVSPHGGCGKTTTAANLAFSFARQKDLRTMFLDLDMRRPQLGQVLGQTSRFTMADVLEDRVTFAEHGNRYGEQVAFGFNNEPVRNSSEILQSQRTQSVLGRIEAEYGIDLMLFDMPPMKGSDDNFGFLKNVDCALLIVAAEKTPMDHIDVIERQLAELTNVLGVVLNKCNYTDGAYGYDYA